MLSAEAAAELTATPCCHRVYSAAGYSYGSTVFLGLAAAATLAYLLRFTCLLGLVQPCIVDLEKLVEGAACVARVPPLGDPGKDVCQHSFQLLTKMFDRWWRGQLRPMALSMCGSVWTNVHRVSLLRAIYPGDAS